MYVSLTNYTKKDSKNAGLHAFKHINFFVVKCAYGFCLFY